jgi:hypothetical protein
MSEELYSITACYDITNYAFVHTAFVFSIVIVFTCLITLVTAWVFYPSYERACNCPGYCCADFSSVGDTDGNSSSLGQGSVRCNSFTYQQAPREPAVQSVVSLPEYHAVAVGANIDKSPTAANTGRAFVSSLV